MAKRRGARQTMYTPVQQADLGTVVIPISSIIIPGTGNNDVSVTIVDIATALGLPAGSNIKFHNLVVSANQLLFQPAGSVSGSTSPDFIQVPDEEVHMGDGRTYRLDRDAVKPYKLRISPFTPAALWQPATSTLEIFRIPVRSNGGTRVLGVDVLSVSISFRLPSLALAPSSV